MAHSYGVLWFEQQDSGGWVARPIDATWANAHSTAVADLNGVFEKLAPRNGEYRHHLRWGDDNGSSHVRADLLGPSLTVPFVDGALTLGTWQQIVLLELDTQPRRRQIVIQLVGE